MDKHRHLVSKYLEGELSPDEVSRFEEALLNDHELQDELDLYREVDEAISDTEVMDLRAQLDELHEELHPQIERSAGKTRKRILRYAVAASVAVIISLGTYGLFFKKMSNTQLVSQFYKPYDVTLVNRSANEDVNEVLRAGLKYYSNEEYEKAIPMFRKALEINPQNMASYLYAGISQFEISQYREANKSLTKVIEHDDNLYIEQAEWYLGFCYLMLNEKEKATDQFRKVKESKGIYSKKARKILRDL